MKIVVVILVLLLAAIGSFAGLLYGHVIKTDKLAQSSPAAASLFTSMGLYNAPHVKATKTAKTKTATAKTVAAEPQALVASTPQPVPQPIVKSQLKVQMAADPPPTTPVMPFSAKLTDIYDSMNPDDLAKIFAKQADSEVVRAMQSMDERKAGKVLSALPPDRAAKIATMLARTPDPAAQTATPGAS